MELSALSFVKPLIDVVAHGLAKPLLRMLDGNGLGTLARLRVEVDRQAVARIREMVLSNSDSVNWTASRGAGRTQPTGITPNAEEQPA
jgi:hypothetical protein